MKKILIPIGALLLGSTLHAQNLPTTENYIETRTYLEPVTTSISTAKQIHTVQYFDGLGRPKQVVSVKASPLGRDVVNHIEYDGFGRQTKDFLPLPQSSTQNGAIFPTPLGNASAIYGSEKIYAEKILENSPLDRIQQQIQVGTDWSTKPVKFEYDANINGEVKRYTATFNYTNFESGISISGSYGTAQLYKTTVTDEDLNKTIEFKNGQGQILLVRKVISATENADTYYVYNDYNQLAYVIPPLASVSSTIDDTLLNNLCYQYKYDGRNRLVEKKVPGKGWEYMVYDKQDRLVLTQDTVLKGKGQWLFTKYDQFSRPIYTGILESPPGRIQQQNAVDGQGSNNETRSTSSWNNSGIDVFYTNSGAYPAMNFKLLSVNYYDTYPSYSFNPSFPTDIFGPTLTDNPTATGKSTKGLPVMSLVKNIEDDNWTKNYSYYDTRGRVVGTYSINHLGGFTETKSELDFAGVPQKINTSHFRKSDEAGVKIKERFVYDTQNRLLEHYHQVDSKPEELLAQNEYNELSQLTNKKVGNNLQSIDYAYNIRGWMTDINKNQMSLANLGGKLFSYKIKYNQKEGISYPNPIFAGKEVKAKYNGNIAEVDWRAIENIGNNPSMTPKRYGYVYDKLNRLTAGYYQNPNNPYSGEHTESLAYDLNGNITGLYRSSVMENLSNTVTAIDNLEYIYATGGNQVTSINDATQNPTGYEGGGGTIAYDLNGSITAMPDKGISSIKYNFLDLPDYLHLNKNSIEDVTINSKYRADGTKITKENSTILMGVAGPTTTKKTTDYLDGFQYLKTEFVSGGGSSEMFMTISLSLRAMQPQAFSIIDPVDPTIDPPFGGGGIIVDVKTPDLQFFPTAEGFYDYQKSQYIYQYRDHLGNNRVSFARNSAGALEITDANDYYPFGMNHLKTGNAYFGQGSYKSYKYNGKELQETGIYDYGARFYMPDIGRWGVVDPLAETSRRWSTYNYAYNNPIRFIDPDGREAKDIYKMDKSGNLTWMAESKTDVIYTEKNFDSNSNLKTENDGGFEVGGKGFIKENTHQYSTTGDTYLDFKGDEAKGMDYFNQVGDWMKSGDVNVEFGIQTAEVSGKDNTVVYTSNQEASASPVYDGSNVKLQGHLHPGTWNPEQISGPLNPSGFRMSKFPLKENGYTFKATSKKNSGDRVSAETMPNAVNFIYVPAHNTTIIYNSSQIIKAYEGKFKKD